MRTIPAVAALLLLACGSAAARNHSDRVERRMERVGDRIDRRMEQRGARIETRSDQVAARIDAGNGSRPGCSAAETASNGAWIAAAGVSTAAGTVGIKPAPVSSIR